MNAVNLYRTQQLAIAAAIDSGDYEKASDLLRRDLRTFAAPERAAPERSGTTGHNRTLTERRKNGIIKAIKRCIRRVKRNQEGKTMKKYIVREYRTAQDGSEYETERYEITANELEETRAELNELTGTAIDRYEIEEV